MTEVIGVKYEENDLVSYVLPNQAYEKDDIVVVRLRKGNRLAQVVQVNQDLDEQVLPAQIDKVLGLARQQDLERHQANQIFAQDNMSVVKDMIANRQLDMKLVNIAFPLDRSHVFISFTAEHRVDFRQLLKDLAAYFRARIELRQINTRDEAKIFGGLGPCGRPLCCSSFLGDFPPVSIKMVKNQGLSLNTGKTTGLCGRLLCCLSFEDDFYKEAKRKFPDYGSPVETAEGKGTVAGMDVFAQTVKVRFADRTSLLTYSLEEIRLYG
ncbi:PSP1 domain-containing protein [Streptococcus downei]|uniref:Signal peptidase II n=1 Tax=Streptococcus downei MFe28 TaxID=764290 RepID=A0A380JEI1_STRDO|nr:regulatory iron-sulfur-containing complex subunit RicT [Streptococcus downei]EFQ56311.1 PSP1 C-terminal domain protein [Streptococcus downei F0415]SUN35807.1 signal peptidase II [Streptococcus downei MFe28]